MRVILFFSYGVSLKDWKSSGLFEREVKFYKYIQSKKTRAKEYVDTVLLFCWDTDSYRLLMPKNVTSIVPLSAILRNKR